MASVVYSFVQLVLVLAALVSAAASAFAVLMLLGGRPGSAVEAGVFGLVFVVSAGLAVVIDQLGALARAQKASTGG